MKQKSTTSLPLRPALFEIKLVAVLSFFLTPVFGSILLFLNWRSLGTSYRRENPLSWIIGGIAGIGVLSVHLVSTMSSTSWIGSTLIPYTAWYAAWYARCAREQAMEIGRLDGEYNYRPLLIPTALFVPALLLVGILIGYFRSCYAS